MMANEVGDVNFHKTIEFHYTKDLILSYLT